MNTSGVSASGSSKGADQTTPHLHENAGVLLAVHFSDQAPENSRLGLGECANPVAEPALADGADLVDRDLGAALRQPDAEARAPWGMQGRGKRADGDGGQSRIENVETHDHHRSSLGHFGPLYGVKCGPAYFKTFHFFFPRRAWYDRDGSATRSPFMST